jgi:hypothetical protein
MVSNVASHLGIIYSATGEFWLGEAINSAKASRRFNDVPHLIFSDVSSTERIEGVEFGKYNSTGDPFLDKITSIERSPFEQTIYLDTDTYVIANLDEMFDLLRRFDVAAAPAPGYTKHPDTGQSEAFFDFNTGVIAYRKTAPVVEFLANWAAIHKRWTEAPPFQMRTVDQASFRRALWESALAVYVLSPEYNYRTRYAGRLVGAAKIIHGRVTNYEKMAAHINATLGPRVFPKFPSDAAW